MSKQKWLQWFQAGLVLIAAFAALYAIYYFISGFDTQIKAAVIAASVAFGVAITSHLVQRKREMEFKIRERKVEAYQTIFDFSLYFLRGTSSSEGLADDKLVDHIYKINYALVMWGSSEAILKWHEFQSAAQTPTLDSNERDKLLWTFLIRSKLAELVQVIRRDLGHEDKNLSADVLADLFLPIRDKSESLRKIFDEAEAAQTLPTAETRGQPT